MRRPFLIALLLVLAAGPALAASAYRIPDTPPRNAAPLRPVTASPARPTAQSRPPALAGALAPAPAFAAAPGLAALGLDSLRLGPADAAPACRQACATTRYQCGVEDPSCVDSWRQCLQGCSGLGAVQR